MKKALLVGTSFSAVPIYFALKKRGFFVAVCGSRRENPCHQYADASIYADYSDRQELLKAAQQDQFDYLVPSCNDYSYMSACWVGNQLGFPGFDNFETAEVLHTKKLFRNFTSEVGVPAPRFVSESDFWEGRVELPVLVKPVDSFSGRGVTKVSDPKELESAISAAKEASRSGQFLIEEFVEGSLHSHSAFFVNQRVVLDFFVDEYCTTYQYQVDCSNHPSLLGEDIRCKVRHAMEKVADALCITDGLIHTQFVCSERGIHIIECMRRCPGDLYGLLVERSTGVDYTDLYVRPFVGEGYGNIRRSNDVVDFIGRHTVSSRVPLVPFSFKPSIPGTDLEIVPLKTSGERMGPAPFDKLAIVFVRFPALDVMRSATPRMATFMRIESMRNE